MALNIFKSKNLKGKILTDGGFMSRQTFKGVKPPKLTSVKNIKSLVPKKLTFLTPSGRKNRFF